MICIPLIQNSYDAIEPEYVTIIIKKNVNGFCHYIDKEKERG